MDSNRACQMLLIDKKKVKKCMWESGQKIDFMILFFFQDFIYVKKKHFLKLFSLAAHSMHNRILVIIASYEKIVN